MHDITFVVGLPPILLTLSAPEIRLYWALWGVGVRGEADLEQLQQCSMVSRRRILPTLDRLAHTGLLEARVSLGVVRYRLARVARTVSMTASRLRDVVCATAAGVRAAVAVLIHTPSRASLAWPGNRRLAAMLGRSVRTVQRGLAVLRESEVVLQTRCPWWKLPGFVPPAKGLVRKRMRVLLWNWAPRGGAQKLSPTPVGMCHAVIRQVAKDLIRLGEPAVSVVENPPLPAPLGSRRTGELSALGLSDAQVDWVGRHYPPETVVRCLSRVAVNLTRIKDPLRYLLGALKREAQC